MSYRGRPSKGCETCRSRKVKCDEAKPICNRCAKLGHDCSYRDQAALLFRNETANAAQKAEDSWRKRSKSHQRAQGESDTSRETPSDHSSPPNARKPPSTEQSLKDPAPALQGSALDFNFNELSISPTIQPDLRRLAYERFLYDFVHFETPSRAPEEPSDAVWDFIPHLYQGAAEGSCLATVVDAVSYSNFAARCNAPQAQILADEYIGKGIRLLQKSIANEREAPLDETLCAVYLMGVYENLTMPSHTGSYITHIWGANALLELRSIDQVYTNRISAGLYDVAFGQMLIGNLHAGKAPSIPIRNIIAAKQPLPHMYHPSSVNLLRLIHSEAHVHADWLQVKQNAILPASRHDLQELVQNALDLDAEFQAWESALPRFWLYQVERNTPDARATYEPIWRNLILGSRGAPAEIHTYSHLKRCWIWMYYRTSRVFLLRDLLEMLNWMLNLPEPEPTAAPRNFGWPPGELSGIPKQPASALLGNVGLRIHHTFATNHLVNIIEKACSAVISHFTVAIYGKSTQDPAGMRGYTLLWPLGIMDAVLKTGLVPDSGPQDLLSDVPSVSRSQFHSQPVPSPAMFRMPEQNMSSLYHNAPVTLPQMNDFPALPPIQVAPPEPNIPTPPPARAEQRIFATEDYASVRKKHVFDSSPYHPFDGPVDHPNPGYTIAEPASIDVAARREWINRLEYYIGTELGIRKAIGVPATEGYLETVKAQLQEILGR